MKQQGASCRRDELENLKNTMSLQQVAGGHIWRLLKRHAGGRLLLVVETREENAGLFSSTISHYISMKLLRGKSEKHMNPRESPISKRASFHFYR